jgi:hypothetical protein
MTTRIGGFPRFKRPAPKPAPAAAPVAVAPAAEVVVAPSPTQPVTPQTPDPRPAVTVSPAPAVPESEWDDDVAETDASETAGVHDIFAETLNEDPDDAPEITEPLQPLPRPQPTVLHPMPASRTAPPPVRSPGAGLMASRLGASYAGTRSESVVTPMPAGCDEDGRKAPLAPPPRPTPVLSPEPRTGYSPTPRPGGLPRPRAPKPEVKEAIKAAPATPAAPAPKPLPRLSMADAGKFQARQIARKPVEDPPRIIHKGYMGRMDLIDTEDIPF